MSDLTLYPHKKFFGYYIDISSNEAYSIKSGRLKKLKPSNALIREKKSGKYNKVPMITFSHLGKPKYCPVDKLHEHVDHNPSNTIQLDVKL